MTIYYTPTDPDTKQAAGPTVDSGFETFDDVELINGEPLRRGTRTRTYAEAFYSDYSVTGMCS
jgi:hypothetical protein